MIKFKVFLGILISVHFMCAFLVSINSLNLLETKYTNFSYINSFFKQGWSFFAPDPVLGSSIVEYKCIHTNKIIPWKNFENGIKKYRSPWTTIFPTKNPGDLSENLGEAIIYAPNSRSNKFCSQGDCSQFKLDIDKTSEYPKIKELVKKLCTSEAPPSLDDQLLGDKIKITYRNVKFYSKRFEGKGIYVDDIVELPVNEYN